MNHTLCETSDLLVFSHLRWDFVFQRPQHLLSRFAKYRRVFYFEEPVFGMTDMPRLHFRETPEEVQVIVPYLPAKMEASEIESTLKKLVDELVMEEELEQFTTWYYSPMALPFSRHLNATAVIFDCMDEFSLCKDAPKAMINMEKELMQLADLVFTGGQSLYRAKRLSHQNIHPFPSSIDYQHFSTARTIQQEPADQVNIPHPRLGFYGVIDERFDFDLLARMAELAPDYHFVMVGPVVNIDPESLPGNTNIHYLGKKDYQNLPLYLAGWDCAIMPYALNDSTRFISPTKTPELLAAGKPVVSTSINDVVHPYAKEKLVYIADDARKFVECAHQAMAERQTDLYWLMRVDHFLKDTSWDITFQKMSQMETAIYQQQSQLLEPTFPMETPASAVEIR